MARFHTAAWRRLFYTPSRYPLVVGATCTDATSRCTPCPWRRSSRDQTSMQVWASECVVDGAEKHHERWRGFVKDWQNSISRVQSGSEKLDRAWQKAYIKIWRLQKRNMYLLRISVGTLFAEPDLKLLLVMTFAKFVLYILHCLFRKCTISWFGNEVLWNNKIIIAENFLSRVKCVFY